MRGDEWRRSMSRVRRRKTKDVNTNNANERKRWRKKEKQKVRKTILYTDRGPTARAGPAGQRGMRFRNTINMFYYHRSTRYSIDTIVVPGTITLLKHSCIIFIRILTTPQSPSINNYKNIIFLTVRCAPAVRRVPTNLHPRVRDCQLSLNYSIF